VEDKGKMHGPTDATHRHIMDSTGKLYHGMISKLHGWKGDAGGWMLENSRRGQSSTDHGLDFHGAHLFEMDFCFRKPVG
jgi:hypothetical protein